MASAVERKVRLISAARHIYDGRSISPNDVFEATVQDAEDLVALHFATYAEDLSAPRQKRAYRRRDMKAEN